MRIARAQLPDGATALARVTDDTLEVLAFEASGGFDALRSALDAGVQLTTAPALGVERLDACRLLNPVASPSKIIAIGLNYADHAREGGVEPPERPVFFAKLPNTLIGPHDDVVYDPADSEQVDYEVELAVIIGRESRAVPPQHALAHVFGYCVANDVSARDAQFADGQWVRGKNFDTFLPIGPWITTADEVPDPQRLTLSCRVGGQVLQHGSTADMIFTIAELVAYVSRFVTLVPGDVLLSGTPAGVGFARNPPVFLRDGDVVTTSVEGLGSLVNPVRTHSR